MASLQGNLTPYIGRTSAHLARVMGRIPILKSIAIYIYILYYTSFLIFVLISLFCRPRGIACLSVLLLQSREKLLTTNIGIKSYGSALAERGLATKPCWLGVCPLIISKGVTMPIGGFD